jgi:hypothetical protein
MQSTDELQASCLDDTVLEGAAKKRKIETGGVSDLIDELKQAKQTEEISTRYFLCSYSLPFYIVTTFNLCLPKYRLQLICELSKKYPNMLTSAEHLLLLQVLIQIQSSRKNIGVMKHLCR